MCRKSIFPVVLLVSMGLAWAQSQPGIPAQSGAAAQGQSNPCPQPPPSDISSGFKAAITREWLDPKAVRHVLNALKLYIDSGATNVTMALRELVRGDHCNEDLYRAALGVPDATGQPAAQGLPDVLQTIATANTRKTQDMEDGEKDKLFKGTLELINRIFNDDEHDGKQALVRINSLFNRPDNFRALYELLDALRKVKGHPDSSVIDLETLRAAFESDTGRLMRVVAKKISAKK